MYVTRQSSGGLTSLKPVLNSSLLSFQPYQIVLDITKEGSCVTELLDVSVRRSIELASLRKYIQCARYIEGVPRKKTIE